MLKVYVPYSINFTAKLNHYAALQFVSFCKMISY